MDVCDTLCDITRYWIFVMFIYSNQSPYPLTAGIIKCTDGRTDPRRFDLRYCWSLFAPTSPRLCIAVSSSIYPQCRTSAGWGCQYAPVLPATRVLDIVRSISSWFSLISSFTEAARGRLAPSVYHNTVEPCNGGHRTNSDVIMAMDAGAFSNVAGLCAFIKWLKRLKRNRYFEKVIYSSSE